MASLQAGENLKQRIEEALALPNLEASVEAIRAELVSAIREGRLELPQPLREPRPDHYARRLLFADEALGVTAVVMTWGPHQATPLHDHAGMWCVEGVVEGEIEVIRHVLVEEAGNLYRFVPEAPIHAFKGNAGSLIPPVEHHVLANSTDRVAVTLHIYGGEMDRCSVFLPRPDGWCERGERTLRYDDCGTAA
jgi:3-mercaptopropionate dioxygenase